MDSAGKRESQKPPHGPPLQARVVAANRTVLTTSDNDPGAHGHAQGGGQSKMNGASEHGQWAWHGKGSRQAKPAEQGHCRRTQPADNPTGTGLEETTASSWPASQQNNSRRRRWPASRRAVQVGGGSAVLLATQEAGSDLPYLSPSHLSPLPVTVHTHSLNLYKTQFSTNLFFCFHFYFYLHYKSSHNPISCHCSANLSRHLTYSQPLRSLPAGE